MKETGKRKEWVKNIAIIFLAVLLVLTFFSNTIKNYSLPEVAAQYTSSGTITSKIRGNGTVEASDPYSVVYKANRKVSSVKVSVGDTVQKGDVLYVLEEGESDDLKAARRALEELEQAYEKSLIIGAVSKDLTEKVESGNMGTATELQNKVNSAKKKAEQAKAYLEQLQREQSSQNTTPNNSANEELDKYIANMKTNIMPGIEDNIASYAKALDVAKAAYVEMVNADVSVLGKTINIYHYLVALLNHFKTVGYTSPAVSTEDKNSIDKLIYELGTEIKSVETAKAAMDLVKKLCDKYDQGLLTGTDSAVEVESGEYTIKYTYEDEDGKDKTFPINYSFTDAITNNSVLKQKSDAIASYEAKLKEENENLTACKNQITIWEGQKTTATTPTDDYATKIANAQAAYDKAQKAYDDLISDINTSYDLLGQISKIDEQKEVVAELEKEQGTTEITAPVDGTVLSLKYVAGETIEQGSTVSTIQVAGKGFTMSVSVPNDKVRLISVGDEAEITNSWWYSDVHARIMAIKPDPANPSQGKVVVFELEGDVNAGQTLSFSVGRKSANYDNIVPNSAIHEDSKGKFIYKINSKNTPLGNRYIIERVDVTILASDDNQSAVSGALEGWDYIVTTTSKPIDDGTEVRLKD